MILILCSGGLRLVLQRANYVVMYDRWWNPAVRIRLSIEYIVSAAFTFGRARVSISIASAIGWALKGRTRFAPGKV